MINNYQELGHITAEKQSPSPVSMYADVAAAISVERRLGRSKATMKDLLGRVCAEYNKMTTIKKHRIDGARKSLLYNLLLGKKLGFHFCPILLNESDPSQNNTIKTWLIVMANHSRLRSSKDFVDKIHQHYDAYPHQQSGCYWRMCHWWHVSRSISLFCVDFFGVFNPTLFWWNVSLWNLPCRTSAWDLVARFLGGRVNS